MIPGTAARRRQPRRDEPPGRFIATAMRYFVANEGGVTAALARALEPRGIRIPSLSYPAALLHSAATTREAFVELKSYAGRGRPCRSQAPSVPVEAAAVIDFWRDAGLERWFAKDADFDRRFRDGSDQRTRTPSPQP